jgi:hypothetical protein
VDYLFVNGSTDGVRKTVIAFERRQSTRVADHFFRFAIDLERRDARLHEIPQMLKDEPYESARSTHLFEFSF